MFITKPPSNTALYVAALVKDDTCIWVTRFLQQYLYNYCSCFFTFIIIL